MSTKHLSQGQQLALAVQLNDEISFADFCWHGNELLKQQLFPALNEKKERIFYFWGEQGSGKSHILQASCQAMSQAGLSVAYLPLKMLSQWDPSILEGIEAHTFVALDDIELIAGIRAWEEAVFHLYNRIYDRQSFFMMSSHQSPTTTAIQLPDLRSRCAAALVMQIHELSDHDKIMTLQIHAQKRGLNLSTAVGQYILNRCARNMHDLHAILDHLDHASLVAQRKLTIPFVKEILEL